MEIGEIIRALRSGLDRFSRSISERDLEELEQLVYALRVKWNSNTLWEEGRDG